MRRYNRTAVAAAERTVSIALDVSLDALRAPTRRTAPVAFARQVAMYLAHTVWGVSQADVAERVRRDRSTVAHACRSIEDRRDDPDLDRRLNAMEALLAELRDALRLFADHEGRPLPETRDRLGLPRDEPGVSRDGPGVSRDGRGGHR